jgi:hypothetical protein
MRSNAFDFDYSQILPSLGIVPDRKPPGAFPKILRLFGIIILTQYLLNL